jgi:hypothetical protein
MTEASDAVGDWVVNDKLQNKAWKAMLGVTAWRVA